MDKHHGCDYSKSVTRCCLLLPFTFATFATFVSGCATPSTVPAKVSVSIDSIYRERAGVIHQGMTRRQVYAVLPPYRRPVAVPPHLTRCMGWHFFLITVRFIALMRIGTSRFSTDSQTIRNIPFRHSMGRRKSTLLVCYTCQTCLPRPLHRIGTMSSIEQRTLPSRIPKRAAGHSTPSCAEFTARYYFRPARTVRARTTACRTFLEAC